MELLSTKTKRHKIMATYLKKFDHRNQKCKIKNVNTTFIILKKHILYCIVTYILQLTA